MFGSSGSGGAVPTGSGAGGADCAGCAGAVVQVDRAAEVVAVACWWQSLATGCPCGPIF